MKLRHLWNWKQMRWWVKRPGWTRDRNHDCTNGCGLESCRGVLITCLLRLHWFYNRSMFFCAGPRRPLIFASPMSCTLVSSAGGSVCRWFEVSSGCRIQITPLRICFKLLEWSNLCCVNDAGLIVADFQIFHCVSERRWWCVSERNGLPRRETRSRWLGAHVSWRWDESDQHRCIIHPKRLECWFKVSGESFHFFIWTCFQEKWTWPRSLSGLNGVRRLRSQIRSETSK